MKKIISPMLAVFLLTAISCKKQESTIQHGISSESSSANAILASSVKIGTQRWMTLNLDVSRYRNGDKIPQVKDPAAWEALTTGAWCYNNNDPEKGAVYGKLYNWYAVNDTRGLAPVGWHIPSNAEFTTLSNYLGGDAIAGGKMKETGTTHWNAPNSGATNSSGFTALPGGSRYYFGSSYTPGFEGNWWTSTTNGSKDAYFRRLNYAYPNLVTGSYTHRNGFSVRCIKD